MHAIDDHLMQMREWVAEKDRERLENDERESSSSIDVWKIIRIHEAIIRRQRRQSISKGIFIKLDSSTAAAAAAGLCCGDEEMLGADDHESQLGLINSCDYMESTIREDIYLVVFQQTINQSANYSSQIFNRFRISLDNLDAVLHHSLETKCLRVEALKRQVDELKQPLASQFLYQKAFISRSHNLKLAETEVDLLGDEVETLVYLLERIYIVLNQNATALSPYFEVYDILKLIKINLTSRTSSKPKS